MKRDIGLVQFLQIVAIASVGLLAFRALEFVSFDGDGVSLTRSLAAQESQTEETTPGDGGDAMPEMGDEGEGAAEPANSVPEEERPKRLTASDVMRMRATDVTEQLKNGGDLTASERTVLLRLAERRAEIEKLEEEMLLREKLVEAAEKRVDERIKELKTIEARLQREEAETGGEEEEVSAVANLVVMYEAMKAKDAARIFNTLELGVLVSVAEQMKPRAMAAVLAAMDPPAAQRLTLALARRQVENEAATATTELEDVGGG